MTDVPLFDSEPYVDPIAKAFAEHDGPPLSNGQKLTLRSNYTLSQGRHPATLEPLAGNGETCGTCAHHHHVGHHDRSYHKCEEHRLGESHSEASDIRVGWPACVRWQMKAPLL